MTVRKFEKTDAEAVSALIAHTLRTTNSKDYSHEYIEDIVGHHTPEEIIIKSRKTHFYLICENDTIIACGSIGQSENTADTCELYTIFVHPDYQSKGVGRKLIETLEGDEYSMSANRIELSASITAVDFYKKLGYTLSEGVTKPGEDGLLRMEKLRT
ncbi:MAG: GNAT family N-acetyltransferase [Clostridia bacterium]|nr:GNAT family N-acetyltransferase [Clostridia bacterium]